ncbi:MAG: hypothetical protein QOF26_2376 [Baekduia sp.]|nr:hypothetical protein [Baekduia sp.]
MRGPSQAQVKRAVLAVARRAGAEERLREARAALLPAPLRQDRADTAHLRRLVAWRLGPDDDAVDVGAHAGSVLSEIVRAAPAGRHVAFEPLPWLAADLQSRFPGVDVHAAALSDARGEREFICPAGNPGWSGFRARPTPDAGEVQTLRVPVQRLDDVLGDRRPALIKIDVEGAEREVLEGGLGAITEFRPTVVFEHGLGSADYYGTRPGDVYELLVARAGLRIFDLDGNGPYTAPGFRQAFDDRTRVNFVAHP